MIVHERIEGSQLAGNLLDDPTERDLFVYLPDGYEETNARYPTAYLLHAYGQTAAQLVIPDTDGQRWSPPLEDAFDPVFRRMGAPPLIVVIPDGWSRWGCGQWVDSPVTGSFEQYVLQDVIPHVDRAYRTLPSARSRGVFGFSSGGFGAWNLASRNPDVFAAMGVLSADSFLDMTHKFILYKYLDSIWPEAPNGPVEGNDWSELVYDYSATYSPNPDNPPFFVDLPVAFPSGELIQEDPGPLAELRPRRQRAPTPRQSPQAVGDPARPRRQRRLQPAMGTPPTQPLSDSSRHRTRASREPRKPRRSKARELQNALSWLGDVLRRQ